MRCKSSVEVYGGVWESVITMHVLLQPAGHGRHGLPATPVRHRAGQLPVPAAGDAGARRAHTMLLHLVASITPAHPWTAPPCTACPPLLSWALLTCATCAPQIFISIIQPYFLAGMVPLMGVYFVIQKFYRTSYIEMQRIDATTRSPIYAHFSETLTGVETLRAYGFEERFALSNERKVDYNHRCACLRHVLHAAPPATASTPYCAAITVHALVDAMPLRRRDAESFLGAPAAGHISRCGWRTSG